MVAFTYYADRARMEKFGGDIDIQKLDRKAVQLAREVANENNALVAGNVSNTREYDPDRHEETSRVVRAMFAEQIKCAVEEGGDFIIGETFSHLGEALIALEEIKKAGLPALITFIPQAKRTFDGYTWAEACRKLEKEETDVVGLNCARGPATIYRFLEDIRQKVEGYVAAQPVPYRTTPKQPDFNSLTLPDGTRAFPTALDPFLLTRYDMANFAVRAKKMGINYIGICCGGAAHHVRSIAESLGRVVPASEFLPDMTVRPLYGKGNAVKEKIKKWVVGERESR